MCKSGGCSPSTYMLFNMFMPGRKRKSGVYNALSENTFQVRLPPKARRYNLKKRCQRKRLSSANALRRSYAKKLRERLHTNTRTPLYPRGTNRNKLRGPESEPEDERPRKLQPKKDRDIADRVDRLAKVVESMVRSQTGTSASSWQQCKTKKSSRKTLFDP